jgi:hypothetical protein
MSAPSSEAVEDKVLELLDREMPRPQPRDSGKAARRVSATSAGTVEQSSKHQELFDTVEKEDIETLEASIAAGAEVNWHNPKVVSEERNDFPTGSRWFAVWLY